MRNNSSIESAFERGFWIMVCEYLETKPQVPPLRFAPVGMASSVLPARVSGYAFCPRNRIVIPTGAYPDFLLRAASDVHLCGSPYREPHADPQRHGSPQEIRGSAVEGPAVSFPGTHMPYRLPDKKPAGGIVLGRPETFTLLVWEKKYVSEVSCGSLG